MSLTWHSIVHLDRMVVRTGAYSGFNTTWNLPYTSPETDAVAVLGPAFGSNFGQVLPITLSLTTALVPGRYDSGEVAIGIPYTLSVALTPPYVRDENGQVDTDGQLFIQKAVLAYHKTGGLRLRASYPGLKLSDRNVEMDEAEWDVRGNLTGWYGGRSEDMRWHIENTTPKPSTIVSIEFVGDYSPRITE